MSCGPDLMKRGSSLSVSSAVLYAQNASWNPLSSALYRSRSGSQRSLFITIVDFRGRVVSVSREDARRIKLPLPGAKDQIASY